MVYKEYLQNMYMLLGSPRRGGLITVFHTVRRRSFCFQNNYYQLLLPHTLHSHHIPLAIFLGVILISISSTP